MYYPDQKDQKKSETKFYAIGTNLPCKNVKYALSPTESTQNLCSLTNEQLNKDYNESRVILYPETALLSSKYINDLKDLDFEMLQNEGIINDNTMLVSGGFLKNKIDGNHKISAGQIPQSGRFMNEKFLLYNAMLAFTKENIIYRVKEKLVPFNEFMPYNNILSATSLITYTGPFHFSRYENRGSFNFKELNLTSLICYESFNGDFVRSFNHGKKPSVILVGLNEGWYNTMKGYKLSQKHATARAIENRKSIIKASNCGFSSYIMPNGDSEIITQTSGFSINPIINSDVTFYQKRGDYLGILAMIITILSGILLFVGRKLSKHKTS